MSINDMNPSLQSIDLDFPQWVGAAELERTPQGVRPWRVPMKMFDFLEKRTQFQAVHPSGVRLRWATDSATVEMDVLPDEKEARWFDLTSQGRLVGRVTLEPGQSLVRFADLPAGDKTLELWLNHLYRPVVVRALRVDGQASVRHAPADMRQRIVFHGSSISHGRIADGPTESWTMGAADLAGLNPLNLGFGGACRLEPIMTRFVASQQADYFNLCLGVNIVFAGSHTVETFRSSVIGLIDRVREAHPTTPIAVQSAIYTTHVKEQEPNALGMSMAVSRQVVRDVVELFIAHGDRHLCFTDGLNLFGPDDAAMLCDGIHPDGPGHRLMSQRWHQVVWPELQKLK